MIRRPRPNRPPAPALRRGPPAGQARDRDVHPRRRTRKRWMPTRFATALRVNLMGMEEAGLLAKSQSAFDEGLMIIDGRRDLEI